MAVPDYQSLMLPLLRRAVDANKPVGIAELQSLIAADLGLTDAQLSERLPSGRQGTFHNRLHWAKQYLTRAGLLESTKRGQFQPTAEGRALLAEQPAVINNTVLGRYASFVTWRLKAPSAGDEVTTSFDVVLAPAPTMAATTPEERIDAARRELDANLKADLLDQAADDARRL
jgi:restriction system protein